MSVKPATRPDLSETSLRLWQLLAPCRPDWPMKRLVSSQSMVETVIPEKKPLLRRGCIGLEWLDYGKITMES